MWLTASGVASCRDLLVGCEKCHELCCLGEEFLLLGFELLESVVLCGGECGSMLLGVLKSALKTVRVLEE